MIKVPTYGVLIFLALAGCRKPTGNGPARTATTETQVERSDITDVLPARTHEPHPAEGPVAEDDDMSWIGDTTIAKRLVSLGFTRQENAFIYTSSMSLGEFKRAFDDPPLHPVPSAGIGQWTKITAVDGNHAVLARGRKEESWGPPGDADIVSVSVNLEINRRASITVGHPVPPVHESLIHLGATEITPKVTHVHDDDVPGRTWSRWYLLPDGTCLVLRVASRTEPRSKPTSPAIRRIILGETGAGYRSADHWHRQQKTHPVSLPLNRYRRRPR